MSDSTYADKQNTEFALSEHARKNRALWEASSDSYEGLHACHHCHPERQRRIL